MGLFDRLFGAESAGAGHLERALLRFNSERSAEAQQAALDLLLGGKLFVPSLREAEDAMKEFSMIVEETPQGPAVVTFTLPERMDAATAQRLGARSGILVEAKWLLQTLPDHLGLMINPGLATGLALPAAGLAAFRAAQLRAKP